MTGRFADTQYYIALLNGDDRHHERAKAITPAYRGQIVTTEWVLAEVGNAMCEARNRDKFVSLVAILRSNANVCIVPASTEDFHRGLALYRDRADKNWSLVDCISFCVMEGMELREALTADHHFEQAGFVALLK